VKNALFAFQETHPALWLKLDVHNSLNSISINSIQYELKFLIERGEQGFPILSSLIELNLKALDKLNNQIELHTAKTPFLALIPLFLLQMPSLMLIFLYPMLKELLLNFTQ